MLREYEVTIVANPMIGEDECKKLFEKYEQVIMTDGGQMVKKTDWGTRKLAYPIKRQHRGRYMLYDLTGLPKHLAEAERLMRIDENVLRYMSVRLGENIDVEQRKVELAKIEASQAQAFAREAAGDSADDSEEAGE